MDLSGLCCVCFAGIQNRFAKKMRIFVAIVISHKFSCIKGSKFVVNIELMS